MKLPRDVSGEELAKRLTRLGYNATRQTGSHVRLTRPRQPEHHITIPLHDSIKVGTLNGILKDIALRAGMTRDEVIRILWA